MKITTALLFTIMLMFSQQTKADQLQWVSKKEAKKAKKILKKWGGAMLYCGCCNDDEPTKVKFEKVKISAVEGEEFYEVHISYVNELGQTITKAVDLAYVWLSKKNETKTVGEWLEMEHDPCKRLP